MIISSKQNPTVKWLTSLRKRRDREEAGVTLVDGFEELSMAVNAKAKVQAIYYCPELMNDVAQLLLLDKARAMGAETTELTRPVFEKVAYREGPDGWLGICGSIQTKLGDIKLSEKPFVLVCESVEKPGNLGAMLRTADAAGVDAVISVTSVTDWSNPNIIRASKGAIFSVPVAETTQDELFAWLQTHNIQVVAATPSAETSYVVSDLTQGVALFVGAEKPGLTKFWLEHADIKVLIPMYGKVESLNVATSAALLMYETLRQRDRL